MKVLIAYDGSECAKAAVKDLRRAGLPSNGQVLVLCAAEAVAQLSGLPSAPLAGGPWCYLPGSESENEVRKQDVAHAQNILREAAEILGGVLPGWEICAEWRVGAAKSVLLEKSLEWKPDLCVVGAPSRTNFSHLLKASISKAVWRQAKCSVRVGREISHMSNRPLRLLIGVDGSEQSIETVEAVATRCWPEGTQVRIVGVVEAGTGMATLLASEANQTEQFRSAKSTLSLSLRQTCQCLCDFGISASATICAGPVDEMILRQARDWEADCIFLGASSAGALERFFAGSVSAIVAANAPCSVELVRARSGKERSTNEREEVGKGYINAARQSTIAIEPARTGCAA